MDETNDLARGVVEEIGFAGRRIGEGGRSSLKICCWFLASFLITIPIIAVGIQMESRTIIAIAGMLRAILIAVFLTVISPVGILFEMLKDGIDGSVKRYSSFIMRSFVAELVFVAALAWIPLKNNPDMIMVLIVLSVAILFVTPNKVFSGKIIATVTAGLLILTIISFFTPYSLQFLSAKLKDADRTAGVPKRIDLEMTCDGIKNNKYVFFGEEGKSLRYYYVNPKTQEIEVYLAVSKNITNPRTGESLKLITREVVNVLEEQVCKRDRKRIKQERDKQAQSQVEKKDPQSGKAKVSKSGKDQFGSVLYPPPGSSLSGTKKEYVSKPHKPVLKRKEYRFAVFSEAKTGNDGRKISQALAVDTGIFDVGEVNYGLASAKAEYIVVIEKISTKSYRFINSGMFYGETSIDLKIMEAKSGRFVRNMSATSKQGAFDSQTAERFALNAAIEMAKKRLKDFL